MTISVKIGVAPLEALTARGDVIAGLLSEYPSRIPLPLAGPSVPAGFPSPADDFIEQYLDLNELLIVDRTSTYMVRVQGRSMIKDGIYPGDILIVDRARRASSGSVVVAVLDGELTVKTLQIGDTGRVTLVPANQAFPVIEIREGNEFQVWGVVTFSIHNHLKA